MGRGSPVPFSNFLSRLPCSLCRPTSPWKDRPHDPRTPHRLPPFGGQQVNPSWQAVKLVAETPPEGVDVAAVELPCVFRDGIVRLREAIERTEPELVVCVGQAGGRTGLTVERVAVNVADARIPDNAGAQPIDEPVIEGGPTAYFTSLPLKACVAAVREVGCPPPCPTPPGRSCATTSPTGLPTS